MTTLDTNLLKFEEKNLYVPKLEEIQNVLQLGLVSNFKEVNVEIVDCPNLKHQPFNLNESGLNGNGTLIEVGGPPYLLPNVDLAKVYNVKEIVQKSLGNSESNILAIGAGAGPYMIHNTNCEGIYNMKIEPNGNVDNGSYIARVCGPEEKCQLEKLPKDETRCALLLNLYACEAKPGKVLRVSCKQRIGDLNYIEAIRLSLAKHFSDKCVGLGGIFLLKNGNAKQHVMRDFSKTPITTESELNNWLKFYEMPGQLNAVGTLITNENDLDLRLQHFHSFSRSNWGGHYHYDTTPSTVEYDGFFSLAEKIVRVDRPINTHKFGRD